MNQEKNEQDKAEQDQIKRQEQIEQEHATKATQLHVRSQITCHAFERERFTKLGKCTAQCALHSAAVLLCWRTPC